LTETGLDVDRLAPDVDGRFASAFVRARKPEATSCCGPECCA
jgi:arsenite methyltransferase